MSIINEKLLKEFPMSKSQVEDVIELLDEGNTVPFIARYRKEKTGGLDDVILRKFSERLTYLRNLQSRKEDVIRLIDEQGKLTDEIRNSLDKAETLTEVEDIYRPFKPKKRTRAIIATEKGLIPLSEYILSGGGEKAAEEYAKDFINEDKGVVSTDEALQGAMDIISEKISDNAKFRKWIRDYVVNNGVIETKGSSEDRTQYEMYYEYSEKVKFIPSHRILAINRGENEKVLSVKIICDVDKIKSYISKFMDTDNMKCNEYINMSIDDSIKRLIYPSIEREVRNMLTEKGEDGAIKIFKENLKALLMSPPIKGKTVMGFDPGFRTGCKVAILDDTGKFLEYVTVHATAASEAKVKEAKEILKNMMIKHNVDVVSLGNGTACRESEEILGEIIAQIKKETGKDIYYVIVSEAGASVYSASELATKEYPDLDVTVRGAISIGRRLQDPLAELVKIDPKSIGVGQYQHDVTVKRLDESLKNIVEDCVNNVGVDLNTATPALLSYISGINSGIAQNIVAYRDETGKFKSRKELLKVKRLGAKAYEQCAGFLRVDNSKEPLDGTSVHPESYEACKKLMTILGYDNKDLSNKNIDGIDEKVKEVGVANLAKEVGIGEPTLLDIIKELKKPGRDPREEMPKPIFKTGVMELSQLKKGMKLLGTVRNVSDFGAFVDIGVHQDGLVHKSQLSDRFVKHPLDVVKLGDVVEVTVIDIDEKRNRISLSMKKDVELK
ncbi:Tex family protein [uncultured Clostridium sp.]|uniref:Tex family protein n=1 Tax=uncultured Clostridium sp. TaxID=59620 RepID=UPI003216828A